MNSNAAARGRVPVAISQRFHGLRLLLRSRSRGSAVACLSLHAANERAAAAEPQL
jgi:hypothetical protein